MVSIRGLARATVVTLAMLLVAAALASFVCVETPYEPDEEARERLSTALIEWFEPVTAPR